MHTELQEVINFSERFNLKRETGGVQGIYWVFTHFQSFSDYYEFTRYVCGNNLSWWAGRCRMEDKPEDCIVMLKYDPV